MKMTTLVTMSSAACVALALAVNASARGAGDGARAAGRSAERAGDVTTRPGRGDGVKHAATQPGDRIDKREANQQKRIEAGVAKGQLTPDEVALLQKQEKAIGDLETTFKSDGKLTPDEIKQLRQALNDASLQIWAQRHDTEGNQKPVSRLGKDIFANDDLTASLESDNLTKAQARAFLQDFHKLVTLKRRLGSDNLTDAQRAEAQALYNELLNKYFHM